MRDMDTTFTRLVEALSPLSEYAVTLHKFSDWNGQALRLPHIFIEKPNSDFENDQNVYIYTDHIQIFGPQSEEINHHGFSTLDNDWFAALSIIFAVLSGRE